MTVAVLSGLVHLDERLPRGTGLVVPDGPGAVTGGRDAAEHLVAGAGVRRRDLLPAAAGVAGDDRELVAAGRVVGGADQPGGAAGDGHAVDVGEAGAHAGWLLRGPGAVAQVLDQRPGLVGRVVALADRPHLAAADRDRLQHARGEAGRRDADDRPGVAVPVLDQRQVGRLAVGLPDGPDVVRAGRGHAVQLVAGRAGIRARHDRPGRAVPVLDQRAVGAAPALLAADGPHVRGGHRGRRVERVALGAELRRGGGLPGAAVPRLDQAGIFGTGTGLYAVAAEPVTAG